MRFVSTKSARRSAVALASVAAVGTLVAVALAAAIPPYSGFEKSYPASFHIPKKVTGKQLTIGCQNPVNAGNETTTTFCKGVAAEASALGMKYIGLSDNVNVAGQV